MIRAHSETPCWEIVYVSTGKPPQDDGWPHYETEASALAWLPAEQREYDAPLTIRRSFSEPCVGFFCDGCGEEIEVYEWTHSDPDDPDPAGINWADHDVIEHRGKHWHVGFNRPGCAPAELCPGSEDNDTRAHVFEDGECVECDAPEPPVVVETGHREYDVPLFEDAR